MSDPGAETTAASRSPRIPVAAIVVAVLLHLMPAAILPHLIGGDEPHYALITSSIVRDGDTHVIDDYLEVAAGATIAGERWAGRDLERHLRDYGERRYAAHPVGLPLLAAPVLWAVQLVAPSAPPDVPLILLSSGVALVAVLLGWRLLVEWLGLRWGTLVGFTIYLGTPLWFYSRIFVTETFLAALATIAIVLVARRRWIGAGAFLAALPWIKESGVILVAAVAWYVWRREDRRAVTRLLGLPAVALIGWCIRNSMVYGNPFVTHQPFAYGNVFTGFVGVLFDPVHGLLPFAPVALLAFVGWWLGTERLENRTALAVFVAYGLMVASWSSWGGGSCFGPRLLVPILPALAVPVGWLVLKYSTDRWFRRLLASIAVIGFTIQGAATRDPWDSFWELSLLELLLENPAAHVLILLIGIALVWFIQRMPEGGSGGAAPLRPHVGAAQQ